MVVRGEHGSSDMSSAINTQLSGDGVRHETSQQTGVRKSRRSSKKYLIREVQQVSLLKSVFHHSGELVLPFEQVTLGERHDSSEEVV